MSKYKYGDKVIYHDETTGNAGIGCIIEEIREHMYRVVTGAGFDKYRHDTPSFEIYDGDILRYDAIPEDQIHADLSIIIDLVGVKGHLDDLILEAWKRIEDKIGERDG